MRVESRPHAAAVSQCCHAGLVVRVMARSHFLRTTSGSGLQLVVLLCCVCACVGQYYRYPINEITLEQVGVEPLAPETRSSRCYNELGQAQVGEADSCFTGAGEAEGCQLGSAGARPARHCTSWGVRWSERLQLISLAITHAGTGTGGKQSGVRSWEYILVSFEVLQRKRKRSMWP